MAGELRVSGASVDPRSFNLGDAVKDLLPRGHVIHGFSSAMSERVIKIQASRRYADFAPCLGME